MTSKKRTPRPTHLCPVHGQPIKLVLEDGKMIGYCSCSVPNNPWLGKRVLEILPKEVVNDSNIR
jgi:hypothetical protein